MKYIFNPFTLLVLMMLCLSCKQSKKHDENVKDINFKENTTGEKVKYYNDVPANMVLIYDGGAHRSIKWNNEHFEPYVSAKVNDKNEWLFDGYLFLEILDGNGRGFASGYDKLPARKIEWKNLLENYFNKGNAIYALNQQIEITKKEKFSKEKFEKRKIVISIPEPIPGQTDWGQVNGKPLRFLNREDRLSACKWYIDYAEKLFKEANFENVELVGFYWLAEEATNSRTIAKDVAGYLYDKQYDFYWIPYFCSDGYSEWKELGYNVPYYQPNYFFSEDIAYNRLQIAYDRAEKYKMNLEVEFDERGLENSKGWGYRLRDYLDVYEKNNVPISMNVAYYQGGDAFFKLSKSVDERDKVLYNKLIDFIIKVNKKK